MKSLIIALLISTTAISITDHRANIDTLDDIIIASISQRLEEAKAIGEIKRENELAVYDPMREAEQDIKYAQLSEEYGVDRELIDDIFKLIRDKAKEVQ